MAYNRQSLYVYGPFHASSSCIYLALVTAQWLQSVNIYIADLQSFNSSFIEYTIQTIPLCQLQAIRMRLSRISLLILLSSDGCRALVANVDIYVEEPRFGLASQYTESIKDLDEIPLSYLATIQDCAKSTLDLIDEAINDPNNETSQVNNQFIYLRHPSLLNVHQNLTVLGLKNESGAIYNASQNLMGLPTVSSIILTHRWNIGQLTVLS